MLSLEGPLVDCVERLYDVFGRYRKSAVAGCPCCVSEEAQARLHAKRLRELGGDALGGFAFSALNTWGTLTDFKHFLPRILELWARDAIGADLQIIYGKFVQDGPWTDEEWDALEDYTAAVLASEILAARSRAKEIIESAGVACMNTSRLLARPFADGPLPERATALADLVLWRTGPFGSFVWWTDASAFDTWLHSGGPKQLLAEAFEAHYDDPRAGEWAEAHDVLEALAP